jgi:hypothetical protein
MSVTADPVRAAHGELRAGLGLKWAIDGEDVSRSMLGATIHSAMSTSRPVAV